jgi:uncharacterized membrane protein YkoI
MSTLRSKLVTATAIGAAALGGAAIANAASGGDSGSPSTAPPHTANGKTETPLSGEVASKVRAVALAKVSGTVERVETNVDSSAPYEAHIRKSDGTEAEVQVTKDFKVFAVNEMGGRPPQGAPQQGY